MVYRQVISVCLLLLPCFVYAQEFLVHQQTFGVEDGLPHREINAVHQCSRGFIWAGTPQGLSRFDGYRFSNYNARTDSFLYDNIWRILEDADGWFWLLPIPPFRDFDIWHPVTRAHTTFFKKFGKNQPLPVSHPAGWVTSANDTTLMARLDDSTLFTWHPRRGIQHITVNDFRLFDFAKAENFGRAIIAADESIWLLSAGNEVVEAGWEGNVLRRIPWDGQVQFNRSIHSHAFPFTYFTGDKSVSAKKKVFVINRNGLISSLDEPLWYPSLLPGAGVPAIGQDLLYDDFAFYHTNGTLIHRMPAEPVNESISTFRAMIFTPQGDIWMGEDFGLKKVSLLRNVFRNYLTGTGKARNAIRGIYADKERVFFNVEHLGPFIFDRAASKMQQLNVPDNDFGAYALYQLQDGRIIFNKNRTLGFWSALGGVTKLVRLPVHTWSVYQTSANTLWLGTDEGLLLFDLLKNEARSFEKYNGFDELRDALITWIGTDRSGYLWLCTNKGLFKAERSAGILARYAKNGEGPFRIPHNVIFHFYEDKTNGTLWLASGGGGLLELVTADNDMSAPSNHFRQFTTLDGLSNEVIYAVYPDKSGNLWLPSDQGIMRFNKETGEVRTFLTADGLPHNEFNRLAHYQKPDGELFFGTINGAVSFYPEELAGLEEYTDPPLRITAYHQFNVSENRMMDRTADLLRYWHITLRPYDRFFRLEIALLNFYNVDKNRYAYRFSGLEDDWSYISERTLRFGLLPYGSYELQIKAQDSRGNWSENELRIPVTVLKPLYLQTWFLLLASIFVLAAAFSLYKWRTSQLKRQKEELEKEVSRRTKTIRRQAEELKSLDKLKSRFYANISHELRTPLSLILGPVNSLIKREKGNKQKTGLLRFVQRNARQLNELVNEILDLSKMETGQLKVVEEPVHFYSLLKEQLAQFRSAASSEKLDFDYFFQTDKSLQIMLDKSKFEKILQNYLSNAMKFTPPGGKVTLIVEESGDFLQIIVKDTGYGIHPDDLPYIFDRFYQSRQPDTPVKGGTGIGLSLVKELAELMGGKVWAESEWGKGSVFYCRFPKKKVGSELKPMMDNQFNIEQEIAVKQKEKITSPVSSLQPQVSS